MCVAHWFGGWRVALSPQEEAPTLTLCSQHIALAQRAQQGHSAGSMTRYLLLLTSRVHHSRCKGLDATPTHLASNRLHVCPATSFVCPAAMIPALDSAAAAASAAAATATAAEEAGPGPGTIKDGDLVIVYESFNAMRSVTVDSKGRLETKFGSFRHKVRAAAATRWEPVGEGGQWLALARLWAGGCVGIFNRCC